MKLIIFGFGNTGRKLYDEIINYKLDTVVAFVDNNTELCNNSYEGIPVILPADISKYKYDSIVIASMYEKEILLQLENMNTQGDIFGLAEYHRYSYTKKRYDEMYLSVEFETGKKICAFQNCPIWCILCLKKPDTVSQSEGGIFP